MLSGLTIRGRCLLAAGLAAAVSAVVLDERDLLRVAAFVLALPLLALWWTRHTRVGLHAERRLDPARVPVGTPVTVRITLSRAGRLPVSNLELEDHAAHDLGGGSRFRVDRLPRRDEIALEYPVQPKLRGVYRVGPLLTHVTDPFGMSEFRQELADRSRLVVVPHTARLSGMPGGSGIGTGTAGSTRPHPGQGLDDAMVREYRRGDDLRRVHWKTTARRDELMVRVDEHPWNGGSTVLLDRRAAAHRGAGTTSSLEWAVSAAASVWLHLHARGQPVRLIAEDGQALDTAMNTAQHDGADRVLDTLAAVGASSRRDLAFTRDPGDGQELIAVLGEITTAGVTELTKLRPHGARSLAVLLDVPRWGADSGEGGFDPQRSAARLREAGWCAVVVSDPEMSVATAWQHVCRGDAVSEGVAP